METMNFRCGHCGNVMAVGREFLGQQVRCPHCQQVVVAPPPPPADPPPEPAVHTLPPADGPESIFGEEASEDLFGRPGRRPLQLPAETPAVTSELPGGPVQPPPLGNGAPPQDVPELAEETSPAPAHDPGAPAAREETASGLEPVQGEPAPETPAFPSSQLADRRSQGGGLLTAYLLIILVPYSIAITIVAVLLYYRAEKVPHPLEYLPDNIGSQPGATRKGPRTQTYQRIPVDVELPAKLRVALGESIRLGDLEVRPTMVEQKRLHFLYRDRRVGGPSEEEALVLHLTLTNVSPDVTLYPTDPAFNRRWKEGQGDSNKPYSFLEAGKKRFYGGPIQWPSREARDDLAYVEGQEFDNQPLEPGETRQTVLCTDPQDPVGEYLRDHPVGRLVWRVHLRRGLVRVRDREVSATAVIGVESIPGDIRR